MRFVDVFVDPSCPWAWIASRWLADVASHRPLSISWRSYCLEIRDDYTLPDSVPEAMRQAAADGRQLAHQMLRIFEAGRALEGEQLVDRLYTEWGRRFVPGHRNPDRRWLAEAVASAGGASKLLDAADDTSWDEAIDASMEEAYEIAGPKAQTPILVLTGEQRRGVKGPVIASQPDVDTALKLWDAVVTLVEQPDFFELTRPRTKPPAPPRL